MGNLSAYGNVVVQTTPVGVIQPFAGVNAPAGWLFCDGSAISRIQYPELFSALSTTYGSGDGSTTFNIPDMRGRMPVGLGTHTDVATLGNNEGATLANRRPKHQHTIYDPTHNHTQNSHAHTFDRGEWTTAGAAGGQVGVWAGTKYTTQNTSSVTPTNNANSTGIKVNPEGASSSTSPTDAPPYLVVNYIIKAVADLPRGGWFNQGLPPVVTQLPSNPQIGDQVYYYNSTTSGYQLKRYDGSAWTTFNDSGAVVIPDTSGRVKMPYQPFFSGYKNNGGSSVIGDFVCNVATVNRGSCYNTTTGIFTCPIAGAYSYFFQAIGWTYPGYGYLKMFKNGSAVGEFAHWNLSAYGNVGGNSWASPTLVGITECNAGDQLKFYVQVTGSNSGVYGTDHNSACIMYLG